MLSALVIIKPLPKQTLLTPGEDLSMNIEVNASVSSGNDIILSMGHSSRGLYQDLTDHLVYDISKDQKESADSKKWNIDMTLPYPYSQASGDITLSVGDGYSGDITSSQLIIVQKQDKAPYFDPAPKSVKSYPGRDVFIKTEAMGSSPLNVRIFYEYIRPFKLYDIKYFLGLMGYF